MIQFSVENGNVLEEQYKYLAWVAKLPQSKLSFSYSLYFFILIFHKPENLVPFSYLDVGIVSIATQIASWDCWVAT